MNTIPLHRLRALDAEAARLQLQIKHALGCGTERPAPILVREWREAERKMQEVETGSAGGRARWVGRHAWPDPRGVAGRVICHLSASCLDPCTREGAFTRGLRESTFSCTRKIGRAHV